MSSEHKKRIYDFVCKTYHQCDFDRMDNDFDYYHDSIRTPDFELMLLDDSDEAMEAMYEAALKTNEIVINQKSDEEIAKIIFLMDLIEEKFFVHMDKEYCSQHQVSGFLFNKHGDLITFNER